MTNQLFAAELDAKVFGVIGWKLIYHGGVPLWSRPDSDEVFSRCLSNNDAEAVRLCLPWLTMRMTVFMTVGDGWSYAWNAMDAKQTCQGGDTLAEALCRLVLAVAEREAEQKEPT